MGEDHLDSSPSETVRRHAETFRSVRERLAAAREREAADELTRAWNEGDGLAGDEPERVAAWVVDGDGLQVLGARAARVAHEAASAAGWTVKAMAARGRRGGGEGPWVDSVVMRAWRRDAAGVAWVVVHWRADPVVVPRRRVWKFVSAIGTESRSGTRLLGARELNAVISSPPADTLECEHETVRGGGGPDGEDRS